MPKEKQVKKYFYRHAGTSSFPGEIYADNIDDAKKTFKKEHNIKRLPSRFEIWQANKQNLGDTNIND